MSGNLFRIKRLVVVLIGSIKGIFFSISFIDIYTFFFYIIIVRDCKNFLRVGLC